jgi:hypothetical protein
MKNQRLKSKPTPIGKPKTERRVVVQRVVRVRSRIILRAYAKVVNSIAHLNDEERRRVMKAANITCGEAP